jgi:hypothetical protein
VKKKICRIIMPFWLCICEEYYNDSLFKVHSGKTVGEGHLRRRAEE